MILFGVRSPLVVDYEESCHRLGKTIDAAIDLGGPVRMTDRSRVISLAQFTPVNGQTDFIPCAFVPDRRRELVEHGTGLGLTLAEPLVDPTAIVAHTSRIGDGTYINAGVVIGGLSMIGDGVLINRASSLGHHNLIGDYASIGPGCTLAGNVRVGAGALIGAGSTILPGVKIGANATIAAGSVVRKHVSDGQLVAGNPARPQRLTRAATGLARGGQE